MGKTVTWVILGMFGIGGVLNADDNFCTKCKVLQEYHRENPSKYKYYEDYLKDVEEKGADAVNTPPEELPPDVRRIMNPEEETSK